MLPEPMLARPGSLPRGDYGFEVKWDGFRALVSTEERLAVRSRRGWDMTERLPEPAGLPTGLVLDGELVAFALDGQATVERAIAQARSEAFGSLSDSGIIYRLNAERRQRALRLRTCDEPRCRNPLPPNATRRRKFCDEHATSAAKTARHRAAKRANGDALG